MIEKVNSKKTFKNRKRSMSASSANSGRSFRATRKRPFMLDGPSAETISKFRPSGEKFLKATKQQRNNLKQLASGSTKLD